MRLIDADALLEDIRCDNAIVAHLGGVELMQNIINDQPTIEAELGKHGRWVDRYGGKYVNPKYECSECRKEAPYRPKLDDLLNWYHEQDLSDYCPFCGAKMDGGVENA